MDSPWLQSKREEELRRALARDDLLPHQRDTLTRLERFWSLRGLSPASRLNYVTAAQGLGRFLRKPFEAATKSDLENYLAHYSARCKARSVATQKIFLKTFYKALLAPGGKEHPDVVSWIALGRRESSARKPIDMLSPDEVLRLANATSNPRDRAIVLVMYESAARASELVNLRVGDVNFDKYGARLTLRGKTGERIVRLIRSAPELQAWLENHHPYRTSPNSPFFLSWGRQNWHGPLLGHGIRHMLEGAKKAAGITKRVHPHLFRHSRLTELAKELSPAELQVFAGWKAGSRMAEIYVHLSGEDVEKKMLQNAGMFPNRKEREADPLAPKACLRCKASNAATAQYCQACRCTLDEGELVALAAEQDKLLAQLPKLMKILKDPRIKEILSLDSS